MLTFKLYDTWGDGWSYNDLQNWLEMREVDTTAPMTRIGFEFTSGDMRSEHYCVPTARCSELALHGDDDLWDHEISWEVYRDDVLVFHRGDGCPACDGNSPIEHNPDEEPYWYINFDDNCPDYRCADETAC